MTDTPKIEISDDGTTLPVEQILTGRAFLFGQSGSGKSNSAGVVIEELLEQGRPVLIVDTDGEYYGLKERYEVLHATGDDEGDVRVGPEHAETLASIALEQNVPIVLDVSAFLDPDDADELVGKVARAMFVKERTLRKPFLLVVEEAHEYIPQRGSAGFAGDHITRIAKRGRKHGLGFLGISQRPANVDKDVVTQASWLVWHRLKFHSDTAVVRDLYGPEWAEAVESFDDGESILDANWSGSLDRIQWKRKRTFDAGATPGLDDSQRPTLRSIDEEIIDGLTAAGEAARSDAERIERLEAALEAERERTAELEREVERLEERNAWEQHMADRMVDGLSGEFDLEIGGDGSIHAEVMEVVEATDDHEETEALRAALGAATERMARLESELARREHRIAELEERIRRSDDARRLIADLNEIVFDRYPGLFDADEQLEALKSKLREGDDRIDAREGRWPDTFEPGTNLLSNDAVRRYVEEVAASCQYSASSVWDVVIALSSLSEGESARTKTIAKRISGAEKTVNGVLNHLARHGVATKKREGRWTLYALDRSALRDRIRLDDQRQAIERYRNALRADGR